MSSGFKKQIEAFAEIMKIMADVWPGDREDIMVAGAKLEETVEDFEPESNQIQNLISLVWKGMIHLYEKDEYFPSVKSASLQGINTLREYALSNGDIPVELFERACNDLSESLAGNNETVESMSDTSGGKTEPSSEDHSDEDGPREHNDDSQKPEEASQESSAGMDEFRIPADADPGLLQEYVTECTEQIETAESALLELETSPDNKELINQVFRSFHTIKGTSAFMGLIPLSEFAHSVETLLDLVRDDVISYDSACTDITLDALDLLKKLLDGVKNAHAGDNLPVPEGYVHLMNVLSDISEFGKKPEEALERSDKSHDSKPEKTKPDDLQKHLAEESEQVESAHKEAGETENSAPGNQYPASSDGSSKPVSTNGKPAANSEMESTVRVNVNRLDRLIDMIGELVIAHSMVAEDEAVGKDSELSRKISHSSKILRELQDTSLTLRMVPLKATFNKMNRLVRDLARKGQKTVRLSTQGEDTEIDRNMVDIINEPLVHLLRNALDHGVEDPDTRIKSGKPGTATISLLAYQEGGKIVIKIEDDGRGMDREKILEKAVSRGLVEPNKKLSDSEVYKLIFLPGFSTAEKVTDLSGRGVGMDVVRRSIEKLQGKVEVASQKGKGTTISLELPFTLAITDGMLVAVGDQRFIIPTTNIEMTFRAEEGDLFSIMGARENVMFRDQAIPVIRLHKMFNVENGTEKIVDGTLLVINDNKKKYALLVDEVIGQQQLVGKSINMPVKMDNISGGAILGDGKVGLILDTVSLLN